MADNAGGLDADRDGIPCEHLLKAHPVREPLDTVTGRPSVAGAMGIAIVVLAAVGGLLLWRRKGSESSSPSEPAEFEPTQGTAFQPMIPALRKVEPTGMLALSITMESVSEMPGMLRIRLNDRTWEEIPPPGTRTHVFVTALPVGEYSVTVTSPNHDMIAKAFVHVVNDDVARESLALRSTNELRCEPELSRTANHDASHGAISAPSDDGHTGHGR